VARKQEELWERLERFCVVQRLLVSDPNTGGVYLIVPLGIQTDPDVVQLCIQTCLFATPIPIPTAGPAFIVLRLWKVTLQP
jgi:hypothetical protein